MSNCRSPQKWVNICFESLSRFGLNWLPPILFLVQASLLLVSALVHSAVWDEIHRVQSGVAHLKQDDFHWNPGNPPLQDLIAAIPIVLFADVDVDFVLSRELRTATELHNELVQTGRTSLLIFVAVAAWVSMSWTRDLFGQNAALCVLCLWSFDPLIMAHGAMITGDLCAAAMGIAGAYAFWKWMRQPKISSAMICGITLGLVLLSKYVWVIMPIVWTAVWTIRRFVSPRPPRWPLPGQLALMAGLALYVVNAGYAFELTCQPWHTFRFRSPTLQQFESDPNSLLGAIPVPLPRHYVMGIDAIAHHVQTETYRTYIGGQFLEGNVWWFHLYGLLVKMPLGTWLLLMIAVYARVKNGTVVSKNSHDDISEVSREDESEAGSAHGMPLTDKLTRPALFHRGRWFDDLMLWLPALMILLFVSCVTPIKMLRYILPMLPFAFIWLGHAFVWAHEGGQWRKLPVYGALAWSVLSSLWVFPHSLSYFNEAAGGTANGHNHLIGASYEWGQDLLFLENWAKEHPEARPLYVSCYALAPPKFAANSSRPMPQQGPEPGWYAIGGSILRGVGSANPGDKASAGSPQIYLTSFLDRKPVDRVAYSIFIYHVNCEQANEMRARLGLELLDCGDRP